MDALASALPCTHSEGCTGTEKEDKRGGYACDAINTRLVLPGGALVAMTVYDFDTGSSGDYTEQLTVRAPAYYGDTAPSRFWQLAQQHDHRQRGGSGCPSQRRRPCTALTTRGSAEHRRSGEQGRSALLPLCVGYAEAQFTVGSSNPSCTGKNLLFAGDSALCTPPPPAPPSPPCRQAHRQLRRHHRRRSAAAVTKRTADL